MYPPPTPPPPSPPLPPLAGAAATRWYHRTTTRNTTVVTTHHGCRNGKEEGSTASGTISLSPSRSLFLLCSPLQFFSDPFVPSLRGGDDPVPLPTTRAYLRGGRSGENAITHVHIRTRASRRHPRASRTCGPTACVRLNRRRRVSLVLSTGPPPRRGLSAVDSSSLSSTAAAAFGQRSRSSSGRRKGQSSSHVAAGEWGKRNDSRDDSVATASADVRRHCGDPRG